MNINVKTLFAKQLSFWINSFIIISYYFKPTISQMVSRDQIISFYFKHTPIKTEGNVSFPIQIDYITDVLLRINGNFDDIYHSFIHSYPTLTRNAIASGDEATVHILCRSRSLAMRSNYVTVYCTINLSMPLIFRIQRGIICQQQQLILEQHFLDTHSHQNMILRGIQQRLA